MKNINTIILAYLIMVSISCKKDFKEINTNPNAPSEVQPSLLLRQVIYNYGDEMSYEGFVAGNLLGQHFTMVDFNLFDRHDLSSPQLGGNPWPFIYTNLLDNELLIQKSISKSTYAVYQGPAYILKAYLTASLTDIYGDVPYSEALKGSEGEVSPSYDSQEYIYTGENGILDNLDQGIAAINSYTGIQELQGDILFNGDLDAWIKFANSLKIKYLMRISGTNADISGIQTIYTSGNFMTYNTENASFSFSDGRPNSFRMQQLRDGDFNQYILSETMEEILKKLKDPRIQTFFRPTGNNNNGTTYKGLLNGPDASNTSISINDYSLPGTIFRENTGDLKANFMTAWETHFLLAEAAEKGLITANGKTLYENGVQLAFDYWKTSIPSTYLTSDSAAYGNFGANKIEQIITQKWIANCINGYEGWIEYRRTGFPKLKTVAASLNNKLIPVRMPYPADESALNEFNYNITTGSAGNSINIPVWWDIN